MESLQNGSCHSTQEKEEGKIRPLWFFLLLNFSYKSFVMFGWSKARHRKFQKAEVSGNNNTVFPIAGTSCLLELTSISHFVESFPLEKSDSNKWQESSQL